MDIACLSEAVIALYPRRGNRLLGPVAAAKEESKEWCENGCENG